VSQYPQHTKAAIEPLAKISRNVGRIRRSSLRRLRCLIVDGASLRKPILCDDDIPRVDRDDTGYRDSVGVRVTE
jgi:hypothetical protein